MGNALKSKRRTNLLKHHIDFIDAKRIFEGPVFEKRQSRHDERRNVAIGAIDGVEIIVVYVTLAEGGA